MRILFLIPGGPQEQLRILPLAAAVAQQLGVQLQVACPATAAGVWKLLPAVEKVLPYEFSSGGALADWANLLGSVREPDFQAVLNFASGWSIDLLLSCSHIPLRVARGGFSCTAPVDAAAPLEAFLAPLGLTLPSQPFRLSLPAKALEKAVKQQPAGDGPLLVLAPRGDSKDWAAAHWQALPALVRQKLPQARVSSLRPGSPLEQAAQVASADVLVSSDPSANQLAQLSGVTLVNLVALSSTGDLEHLESSQVLQALGLS